MDEWPLLTYSRIRDGDHGSGCICLVLAFQPLMRWRAINSGAARHWVLHSVYKMMAPAAVAIPIFVLFESSTFRYGVGRMLVYAP